MPLTFTALLVSTSRSWIDAVQSALGCIDECAIDQVASGAEALARLVGDPRRYSCVLVQPSCSADLLMELHGVTSGEPGSSIPLVLLGPVDHVASGVNVSPRIPVIAHPTPALISAALSGDWRLQASEPPSLVGADLQRAFAESMIETRYQPIVRIDDGACVGLEALARLNHPQHGLLGPHHFVRQLEDAGRAGELAELSVRHALAELSGPALHGETLTIALNAPLDIILVPEIISYLDERCSAAGIAPGRIVIELTESRPVRDFPALAQAIGRLRAGGYGAAIDDLSPEVPYYEELLQMPFSAVKLDIGVIRDRHGQDGRAFLDSVIATAKANGMCIIAEGVEDMATWRDVDRLGVDEVQGFLVARPLPARAVPIWLASWETGRARFAQALRASPDQTSL